MHDAVTMLDAPDLAGAEDREAPDPDRLPDDLLALYFREIGRRPLLLAAEELQLAREVESGRAAGLDRIIHALLRGRARSAEA